MNCWSEKQESSVRSYNKERISKKLPLFPPCWWNSLWFYFLSLKHDYVVLPVLFGKHLSSFYSYNEMIMGEEKKNFSPNSWSSGWSGWQFLCGLKNKELIFFKMHCSVNCHYSRMGLIPVCLWDRDVHLASMLQCNHNKLQYFQFLSQAICPSQWLSDCFNFSDECEFLLLWLVPWVQKIAMTRKKDLSLFLIRQIYNVLSGIPKVKTESAFGG